MKIQVTPQIATFFKRCLYNMSHDTKNDFLGLTVSLETEASIQQAMQQAHFHDFQGSKDSWPSLYISTQAFLNSPYHQAVRFDSITSGEFRLSKETIQAHELFNLDAIQQDPERELNDSMILRALDQPYEATVLWQADEVWMLDVPSEAQTIDPYTHKAHGKVLSFGLGIGYFVFMTALNPKVTSITVVEQSQAVIDLFNTYLRPQFPQTIPINIIRGDAFDYFNASTLNAYDYTFVDIWQSSRDGLDIIEALLQQHLPPLASVDFWIESSCLEVIPALILRYFEALAQQRKIRHPDERMNHLFRKIDRYFSKIQQVVNDEAVLKHWMYDTQVIREILSQQQQP